MNHALLLLLALSGRPGTSSWHHEELRRFPADEAHQGVAVDDAHDSIDRKTHEVIVSRVLAH